MDKFKNNSQKGFTLINVIVSAAVAMTFMVAFQTYMIHQSRNITSVEDRAAMVDLKDNLKKIFSDPDACNQTFGGLAPAGGKIVVNALRDKASNVYVNLTTQSNYENLRFMSFELKEKVGFAPVFAPGVQNRGLMTLEVEVRTREEQRLAGASQASPLKLSPLISLDLSIRADNGIIDVCSSTPDWPTESGVVKNCQTSPKIQYVQKPLPADRFRSDTQSCTNSFGPPAAGSSWRLFFMNCIGGGVLVPNQLTNDSYECFSANVPVMTINDHIAASPISYGTKHTCCETVD